MFLNDSQFKLDIEYIAKGSPLDHKNHPRDPQLHSFLVVPWTYSPQVRQLLSLSVTTRLSAHFIFVFRCMIYITKGGWFIEPSDQIRCFFLTFEDGLLTNWATFVQSATFTYQTPQGCSRSQAWATLRSERAQAALCQRKKRPSGRYPNAPSESAFTSQGSFTQAWEPSRGSNTQLSRIETQSAAPQHRQSAN